MLRKKSFINALLLTSFLIIAGCAAAGRYKNDHSRFLRIASKDCISFGHVFGSDGYNQCMEKRLREVLPQVMTAARQGDNEAKSRALKICLNLAKQGDVTAMYNVGYMCLNSWGGKQDTGVCIKWLETAAESGHGRSAKVLSGIYSEGKFGIAPDDEKADYWRNLPAVQEFAKGEPGIIETDDDMDADLRIGHQSRDSGNRNMAVNGQLPIQSAATAFETQIKELPQFEPETVNIPPPDGDSHITEAICRAFEFTGSRFKYRVCATKAEWEKIDEKNRRKTEEFTRELKDSSGKNTGLPEEGMAGHMPR